jgi:hypothetical protein
MGFLAKTGRTVADPSKHCIFGYFGLYDLAAHICGRHRRGRSDRRWIERPRNASDLSHRHALWQCDRFRLNSGIHPTASDV